jgi:hypothetical protein
VRCANLWRLVVFLLFMSPSQAQQQPNQQATPPDRPIDSRIGNQPNKGTPGDVDADREIAPVAHSLSGAFDFSLGTVEKSRSYWQPFFTVTSIADSNPLTSGQTRDVTSWSLLYGGVDLRRKTRQSDLVLSYLGGGLISNDGSEGNWAIQQFEAGEKVTWGRSTLSFFDLFDQLPETSFGFSVPLTVNLPAAQDLLLQPVFLANQSILTTWGERIGNASVGEFDRALTRKTSMSFVGAYSLLDFLQNSTSFNYGEAIAQGGLDHQLNRGGTVGMLYRFSALRFGNFAEGINTHTVQLSYGQRIAGKLGLRLAAGPGIGFFQTPVGAATTAAQSASEAYWTADVSLTYQQRHTVYGLAYDRSLSGGGGVLSGAMTDQASGSLTTQFSGALKAEFTAGYARNRGLNTPLTPPSTSGQVYDYWFTGVNLSHPWGRWTSLNLSYEAQYQSSNANFCIGAACQKNLLRQTGSIGFTWRTRPVLAR